MLDRIKSQMLVTPSNRRLFGFLLGLTGILLLLQVAFVVHADRLYFGNFRLVAKHLEMPWRVFPAIFGFVAAQLLVHFIWAAIIFLLIIGVRKSISRVFFHTLSFAFLLWLMALLMVGFTNHFLFPNSAFSVFLFLNKMPLFLQYVLFGVVCILPVLALLFTIFQAFLYLRKRGKKSGPVIILLGVGAFYFHQSGGAVNGAATVEKPDIILIGIDSLRPDFLGFNGADLKTPHLDNFLGNAVNFSESITPLARTYPAWVSILTGQHPFTSGIRTNLFDVSGYDFSETLPARLRSMGYHTVFATDESRFSNIDTQYGFDESITPPQGVNDFLLGSLNDFPLSNLLVNTPFGRMLFPWSYANRAVFSLYDPHSFITRLRSGLSHSRDRPLFLAVHFCLPHHPYAWSGLPAHHKVTKGQYRAAIHRMDLQFSEMMDLLRQDHLLDHALVVLFSDHGEALEMPGDRITDPNLFIGQKPIPRFYPPSAARERMDMSGGHGTDVLGLSQYHTVLAFRSSGLFPMVPRTVKGMVSLLDIRPTVLDFFGSHLPSDGVSLLSTVQGRAMQRSDERVFFVESDFSPAAVRSVHPSARKVLFQGIHYFRIDPLTTRIVVRDDMLKWIISSKQLAIYQGAWVVALYPKAGGGKVPILVNLQTGQWTNDLTLPFAKKSPAGPMLAALKHFFQL